jgi:FecR-like protein
MTDQELIHRFLEDPAGLAEADLEQLIAHLRSEPAKAVELREQLIVDDLLGQKLAVDRKNFIVMVQQRLTDYERGEEEVYNQVAELRAIAEAEIERKVHSPGINPWIKFVGGISLIVVPLLCFVVWRYQESAPRAVANVEELSGQVVRVKGSTEEPLRVGQAVSTGETIVAAPGSTVLWKYKDGTTVRILGDSETEISADASLAKQVRLERGELVARVAKQIHGAMVFTTPHATATVVGTELRLVVAETNTQLDVTEGKVDFQRNSSSQVLRLAANESGIATAVNIQENKASWPVNRASAAFLYERVDKPLARNPETGNLRVTSLPDEGDEAGKDTLSFVRKSGEFACDILFTPDKTVIPQPAVLCSFGPYGNENFLLLQKGKELIVQLRGASSSTPIVVEVGEITLGSSHYLSFACKEGALSAVVDGVEVSIKEEMQTLISSWEEGPLVLKADAGGKRPWTGEIAALAIFDQFVDKALSDANRKRYQQLHP